MALTFVWLCVGFMFTDSLQNAAAHSGSCAMAARYAARASGDLKTANEMQAFSMHMGAGVAGYRLD